MIVCKQCGHENAGGQAFCESCHAFLEWDGEKEPASPGTSAAAPTAPAPAPAPATSPEPAPVAVAPAVEHEPPPPRAAAASDTGGGLICSACGQGNETTRHFCKKCGAPLGQQTSSAPVAQSSAAPFPWAAAVGVVCLVAGLVLLVIVVAGW